MKILWIFIYLISLLNLTRSFDVSCLYTTCGGNVITGYCCDVRGTFEINSPNNTKIQSVSTNHNSGKSNEDVIGFHYVGKTTHYFPSNIDNFYKNIQVIFSYSSHLKELHKSDLKPFAKLNEIYMSSNEIEILEEGLFEFNLDLKSVKLDGNKIFYIHTNTFDNLSKLTYLLLLSNVCINVNAQNDRIAVQNLITQIKTQCQDSTFISVDNQVKSLKNESKSLSPENFQTFRDKVENLDNQVKSSKFSKFTSLLKSLQYLKNIEKPEGTTTASPKFESLKMLDTCSTLDSKFDEFSSNFSSMAIESINLAKNFQTSCINETISYIDKKFSIIDVQISTQSIEANLSKLDEKIDKKLSVVSQKLSIFDDQANVFDKISSFDEKLLNFDKKLTTFDDKFGILDEKLSDFDEKLSDFDEKSANLGDKTTVYEEYLSDFQASLTKKLALLEFEVKETRFKMLKSNELRNGHLETMLIKKIDKIEKSLEDKIGKIMQALDIKE